jgi:hypothetical protein
VDLASPDGADDPPNKNGLSDFFRQGVLKGNEVLSNYSGFGMRIVKMLLTTPAIPTNLRAFS